MKKILIALITIFTLTGCMGSTATGDYKEGVYFGYDVDSKYTAVVTIDSNGNIAEVLFDAAYLEAGSCVIEDDKPTCTATTKRILGDDYGMARSEGQLEWYEQMDALSKKIVEENGIDFIDFKYRDKDENGNYIFTSTMPDGQTVDKKIFTDAVSKVTVHVIEPYNAVKMALDKAKK